MGWFTGGLVAYCTVSLVVGSNVALSNPQTDARTSNTHDTNGRLPIFPRRGLSFRNDTSISKTSIYTSRTSAVPTDSAVANPAETELSSTSTLKEHSFSSAFTSLAAVSNTLLGLSSNVRSTSSDLDSSGVVSHSTTKGAGTLPSIFIPTTASAKISKSIQVNSDLPGIAPSNNASRTATRLAVTPEPRPNLSVSLLPTSSQNAFSAQTSDDQLPTAAAALVSSLSNSLSNSPLSTTYTETQQQKNQSTIQHAGLLASESIFSPSPTAVAPSQQYQHLNVPTETSSAFSNLGTALSMFSNTSRTAGGIHQHLVASFTNTPHLISSTAGASRSGGSEGGTAVATTLTGTISYHAASASEILENLSAPTTPVPNNTLIVSSSSTIRPEGSAASASWISLASIWASSQSTTLSTSILSVKSGIPTLSSILPTTGLTAASQAVISNPSGSSTAPLSGNTSSLLSGLYPTSVSGNEDLSRSTRSGSSSQTTQTSLQPSSLPTLFTQTSLMFIPIQTSTPIRTVEIPGGQYVPSSTFSSSETALPFPTISTSFTGWTNMSASKTTEQSAAFSQPTISTRVGAKSSTGIMGAWHMSKTSSQRLSSASTLPSVSEYMFVSSFVTRTKTSDLESPWQTTSVSNDISSTITTSRSTVLFPMNSPTDTVAATPPPPLTSSETAGVAIGSTAGILLAIVAAVFVVRRYHANHSAKHGSDGSSRAYPEVAYLYDPSLGRGSDNGKDGDASASMPGGAMGRQPASTGSRTPPPVPNNSLDYGYRRLHSSSNASYSDPGNPFTDAEDPFLEWRSSDAITTPSDTVSALAAAVSRYSNGPQRPLPPVPNTGPIHAFSNHTIPSPTLSPLTKICGRRHSLVRSSRRSSVASQTSLIELYCSSSSSSSSKDCTPFLTYGRGPRQSLTSIHEADNYRPISDLIEHDLLLPVDIRSETSGSVVVYAATLTSKPPTQHSPPTTFNNPVSISPTSEKPDTKHTQDSRVHSKSFVPSSGPAPSRPTSTNITYADFPSPPTHKGWDEIKRVSTDYTILVSPLSPPPLHPRSPPLSPPPPLKNCSLIHPTQRTRLSGIRPPISLRSHRSVPTPLTINKRSPNSASVELDASKRSFLAKVQSMGDLKDEKASEKRVWGTS